MEFYTEKHPIARKVHKCHICGSPISVGEQYSRESGKFEGDFFDRSTCQVCWGIRQADVAENSSELYDTYSLIDFVESGFCSGCDNRVSCESIFICQRVVGHFSSIALEAWKKLDKK